MRTIVMLMDSLSRRFLPTYGNDWVKAPNIERLAARSCVFENHFVGSAPCMPARHDLLTGRMDFLERNWGPIQPYDCTLPVLLRKNGIFSHICTDHYHYFRIGGENYHTQFDSWDFIRGQEADPMVSCLGAGRKIDHYGRFEDQYDRNRQQWKTEEEFPSPKTLTHAAEWVEEHAKDDDWMIFVDSCDPHEPYDLPDDAEQFYEDDYDDKLYYWPKYAGTDGVSPDALAHIRKRYASLITMSDKYVGKILDVLDRNKMWEDTLVIFTADHGFMLGEKDYLGKNYLPAYNEIYNIPLMIHAPGMAEGVRSRALTQNIDLMPTLLEYFGVPEKACQNPMHGKSLLPVLRGETDRVHDTVLYGVYGKQVNLYDGRYTYFRSAVRPDNLPLNLYTGMPTTTRFYFDADHADFGRIATGRFLSWTDYPVYRYPAPVIKMQDDSHRFDLRQEVISHNMLFDLDADYEQEHPIDDAALEEMMCDKLRAAMRACQSPAEQFVRLGL